MSDDLKAVIFCVLFNVLGVVFISIKEKDGKNIFRNLGEFFAEWLHVIKTVIIPLLIILLICFVIGNAR